MQKIKKRKWYIPIGIAIFIIIIVVTIFNLIEKNNKQINSVNDFANLKELIEYNDCKYIKTTNSKEQGYQKDIYMEFSKPAIEDDGTTNEILYKNLASQIAGKMIGTNFRIIDESKEIIIRVQFKENVVNLYTINNDPKYFESLKTKYQSENYKEDNITNIQIQSNELNTIINNNWKTTKLNLGTMDSICDNYNIYFDEGYKIREVNAQVFNIIFTKQYTKNVFENIKTGMEKEDIIKVLGEPTYEYLQNDIIGYKSNLIYTFFHDGEISIYRVEDNYDTTEFASLVTEYNNTNDYNTFISKLTDLWPDYDVFERNSSYVNLKYSLKGIEITLNTIGNNGITIYNNYEGKIAEDASIEDIKNGKSLPKNIFTELDKNMIFLSEQTRVKTDDARRNPSNYDENLNNSKYILIYSKSENGGYNKIRFYSKDKNFIDSELKEQYINGIYKLDNDSYMFNIEGKGIYKYIPQNAELQIIIEGNSQFKVNKVENNIIYYDNSQINIK